MGRSISEFLPHLAVCMVCTAFALVVASDAHALIRLAAGAGWALVAMLAQALTADQPK